MGAWFVLLALVAAPGAGGVACHLGSSAPCRQRAGNDEAAWLRWIPEDVSHLPADLSARMRAIARLESDQLRLMPPAGFKVLEMENVQVTDDLHCLGWYEPVLLRQPPPAWRWLALDVAGVPSLQPGRCTTLPRVELLRGR